MRLLAALLLSLLSLAPAGCGTGQGLDPAERAPEGFAPWTETAPDYRIGAGDRLRVQFLMTPEMNETVLVAPDGQVALRAAGRLGVAGMSVGQAEAAVEQASRRILIQPVVTVGLEEAGASTVLVGGAVRNAGAYPLPGRRGVLEAVLQAGGFDPEARMGQVVLIRRGPGDRPMLRTVDVRGFIEGSAAADVPLFPGDIVYVPRSRIGEVNLWIEQFVNRLVPFNRSFSYTINRGTTGLP
ncbi:polysaccharide biosynthesis/export family protein [Pseudoroseomonas cervicalis]|uniref:Polysaccharide biosynthesis/export protein n=1 Tax=Pseudoroseomonas cervicalis ATCC 49957 TaxID=525371 RepID=D5RNH4_9PROT|nr:polysaccharide biosynthesis/export family protein [Pseudoroseomonas cervicalis]EFH11145.1 polysaccharide biosynthesis/export protein [Pseudoroseomonas cervicalis ATCC 49957]